jgi:hypothetical protein
MLDGLDSIALVMRCYPPAALASMHLPTLPAEIPLEFVSYLKQMALRGTRSQQRAAHALSAMFGAPYSDWSRKNWDRRRAEESCALEKTTLHQTIF